MKPMFRICFWMFSAAASLCSLNPQLLKAQALSQLKREASSLSIESIRSGPLAIDKEQRLRVLATLASGERVPFEGRVKWSSENDRARVSESGYVTGVNEGKAQILVESLDSPALRASLEVDVVREPILIYFQAPKNWAKANVWYWYLDGDADVTGLDRNGQPLRAITAATQGAFPGPEMKAVPTLPGWFSIALPRFDDASQYPGRSLVPQPLRLVFSNPDNGEKTRDFLHEDGCFYAYNAYLRPGLIDGRWDSPNNCPAFPKKPALTTAKPVPLDPLTQSTYKKLGVTYTEDSTTFAIWSPDRSRVELWLDGRTIPMPKIADSKQQPGIYALTVPGNHYLKRYHFILDDVVVRDPYAFMVEPGTDYCIVLDPQRILPEGGWAPPPPLVNREDAIIYEMSIRDFTISATSGVAPEQRGKFLGLIEAGTFLNKGQAAADTAIKTGIDHLKELGVTHVQLMPVYDYATCSAKDRRNGPDCYNWGYDPENFNIPEERYSTRPYDYEYRIREFQTMVNELHKAGIRVIIDVVYNHTWVRPYREADEGEKYLGDITGKYFLFDSNGIGYQLTGTGNTIDPKNPQVNKYIQDSLEYWVRTYNVDGFRFDVAGVFDYGEITTWMTHLYDVFPDRQLLNYGEPYTALPDPDPNHFRLDRISSMTRADGKKAEFGGFNFAYREAIKGNNDSGYGGGYVFNDGYDPQTIINGLRGSLGSGDVNRSAFASDPVQTINYATSHDNLNLFDKIQAWASIRPQQGSDLDYKKRIQVFANAMVLMSQGVPLIHSGEEIVRTKNGNPNTYQAPDSVNRLDWNRKKQFKDVADAYAQMVQARRRFAGLRLPNREEIDRSLQVQLVSPGVFEIKISPSGKQRQELLIILNSGNDRDYSLPAGEWNVAFEQSRAGPERKVSGRITAAGTAATLLYR